ncbi:MAG TPA: DUF4270 family protein, partial [Pedobacter sp.]|nr:DUF4270 family protein [Pedobacter sp.]
MKFIKQDLLTLLIGLFLFSACKSTNTIDITPDPDFAIKGELVDTAFVALSTVADDPSTTIGMPRYPLGYMTDNTFGTTEAGLVLSVSVPANNYDFGEDPIIDSAVLVLPYSASVDPSTTTHFYGDTTTSVYSFDVQQLEKDLSLEKSFPSNKNWLAKPEIVGEFTGKLKPKTRPTIKDIVKDKADTSRTVPTPQIRIKLHNDFVQNNILNLDSALLSRNDKFTGSFKGLKLSVNKTNVTGKGGIVFLDFSSTDELARANIAIYYRKLLDNSLINRDTAVVYFPVAQSLGPIAATVVHDYTGTPVKEQLDVPNPGTPYKVTYLQALSGLRNKVSFPYLTKFIEQVKGANPKARIIVNKAELVVNVSSGTDVAPYTPAERLSLYKLDIAGQRANLIDNTVPTSGFPNPVYTDAFGGYYD